MQLTLFVTAISVLLGPTIAGPSGINNRGSGYCAKGSMSDIYNYLMQIPDLQLYKSDEHIACTDKKSGLAIGGGTCAFLQGVSGTVSGLQVKRLITLLSQHPNTEGCGSIPIYFPPEFGGHNVLADFGMLTVNYVQDTDNPCPPGVCGATSC